MFSGYTRVPNQSERLDASSAKTVKMDDKNDSTYYITRKTFYKYNVINDLYTERNTQYVFNRLNVTMPYYVIMGNPVRAEKTLDVKMSYDDECAKPSCTDCHAKIEWKSEEDILDKRRDWGEIVSNGQRYGPKYIRDFGCCVGCGSVYFDHGAKDRNEIREPNCEPDSGSMF